MTCEKLGIAMASMRLMNDAVALIGTKGIKPIVITPARLQCSAIQPDLGR